MSLARKTRLMALTGKRKARCAGIHRAPSRESPPPVTIACTCVRIWGRSLKNDGALNVAEIKSEYELPNCNGNWGAKVSCGDDKIATGIRAHAKESWNGFSGLTLRCGKVIPK